MDKCKLQPEVNTWDTLLTKDGIRPQPEKLKAIVDMPNPNNQSSFLGMVTYYDRFTPGLASKCANLNELLHKDAKQQWNQEHFEYLQAIKASMTSTEALAHSL